MKVIDRRCLRACQTNGQKIQNYEIQRIFVDGFLRTKYIDKLLYSLKSTLAYLDFRFTIDRKPQADKASIKWHDILEEA